MADIFFACEETDVFVANNDSIRCPSGWIGITQQDLVDQVVAQVGTGSTLFPELTVTELADIQTATLSFLALCFVFRVIKKQLQPNL